MKKIYMLFFIFGLMVGGGVGTFALWFYLTGHLPFLLSCKNISLSDIQAQIPMKLPPDSEIAYSKPSHGLCEVIVEARGRVLPVYLGKDFAIVGQFFSHKKNLSSEGIKKVLTENRKQRKDLFLKNKEKVEKAVSFVLRPYPHTKHTIYLFTDPLCPFCHRVEKKLFSVASSTNSTIKIIFYPVHIPQGEKVSIGVICSKIPLGKYLRLTKRQRLSLSQKECPLGKEKIEEAMEVARLLNINSVPRFILEDGTQVIGANIARLKRAIHGLD